MLNASYSIEDPQKWVKRSCEKKTDVEMCQKLQCNEFWGLCGKQPNNDNAMFLCILERIEAKWRINPSANKVINGSSYGLHAEQAPGQYLN